MQKAPGLRHHVPPSGLTVSGSREARQGNTEKRQPARDAYKKTTSGMLKKSVLISISAALVSLLAVSAINAAFAQPTPEQLKAFQQLSPAEREALLKTLKRDTVKPAGDVGPEAQALPDLPDADVAQPVLGTPKPPRLKVGDTILVRIKPVDGRERRDRPAFFPRGEERQPEFPEQQLLVLDQFGAVSIDRVGRIVLKGLNEEEAAARLQVEPALQGHEVSVRILPIEEPLKPFGYDLFASSQRALLPGTDIPVPADYVVGPGDVVVVQLFGKESAEHELTVTRDGNILFPGIGPIPVAGLKFSQLENRLQERVQRQLIGMKASITLGKLRSVRVLVLGDVERPGAYALSGLASIPSALLAAGGVKRIGSLRDVQLKRQGKIVARRDLYDLLLRGDSGADVRLQSGDVVFVPPVGRTAGIAGRVRRPAIYELKDEKTVGELIAMAGGLAPEAYLQGVRIERIVDSRLRTIVTVDLSKDEGRNLALHDGDIVKVFSVADRIDGAVRLVGHAQRPGDYQWKPGMRLTDLIGSVADLQPDVDARYLLIRREDPRDQTLSFVSADLSAALARPDSEANVLLQPRDEVHVFAIQAKRDALVKPLLEQARLRTAPGRPVPEVVIEGVVHHPGTYPYSSGMRAADLLRAGGGLTDRAYTVEAELTRFNIINGKEREQSRMTIDVAAVLRGEADKDVALQPYDRLVIRRIPKWDEEGVIEIVGEVRFPGKYPIGRKETLASVIERAGGFTEQAYPKGAIFLRETVRQREQEHLERLVRDLERDLAVVATQGQDVGVKKEQVLAEGQVLLQQLRTAKAAGRMVIRLDGVERTRDASEAIIVQGGDRLYIPRRPQEVTVLGEVYYPTSHLYKPNLDSRDYVRMSGGVTEKGNKGAIYVVHADGSVSPPGGWFTPDPDIGPGDTIVVPLKLERIGSWQLFKDAAQILFQLAVTVAALDAIGVF